MEEVNEKEDAIHLTTVQLAERWHLNPRTIQNWRTARRGPNYIKIGPGKKSQVLYRIDDVIDYEKRQVVKTRDEQ